MVVREVAAVEVLAPVAVAVEGSVVAVEVALDLLLVDEVVPLVDEEDVVEV